MPNSCDSFGREFENLQGAIMKRFSVIFRFVIRAKSDLGFLIQKEFKQFFRNPFLPRILLGFPVMVILVIPWVANMEIKNINISVLDFDKSAHSAELIAKISAGKYFNLAQNATSFENAKECIYSGKYDIILEIPNDFEANLVAKNGANVALYANAINSTKGTLGAGYLSNIIAEFGAEKNAKIVSANANTSEIQTRAKNLEILSLYAYNPHLDYKLYMIPALSVMVLTLLCGFLPAFNIIGEKQSGNIEQINVSPLPKSLFILSKIIPYWIMGIVVISVCFLLAFAVYGFASSGGYGSIYAFAFAYILVVTGLGLVISNYSQTMQQAMFISYFYFDFIAFKRTFYFDKINAILGRANHLCKSTAIFHRIASSDFFKRRKSAKFCFFMGGFGCANLLCDCF